MQKAGLIRGVFFVRCAVHTDRDDAVRYCPAFTYGTNITHSTERKADQVSAEIREKAGGTEREGGLGRSPEIAAQRVSGPHPQPLFHHRSAARIYPFIQYVAHLAS